MSYTICSRFKGEHIVYAGYTICTSREHIVYGAFCGSTTHIRCAPKVRVLAFISVNHLIYAASEFDDFKTRTDILARSFFFVASQFNSFKCSICSHMSCF